MGPGPRRLRSPGAVHDSRLTDSSDSSNNDKYAYVCIYKYICIQIERERERQTYIYIYIYTHTYTPSTFRKGGADLVGNPHRAQISQFKRFELILLLASDKQFPVDQFEATVSRSTVRSPFLCSQLVRMASTKEGRETRTRVYRGLLQE